jgi:hypothetical protein
MLRGRPVSKISLSQVEFEKLQLIERRPKSEQGLALRASIILGCAQGKTNEAVAQDLGVCKIIVITGCREALSGVRAFNPRAGP